MSKEQYEALLMEMLLSLKGILKNDKEQNLQLEMAETINKIIDCGVIGHKDMIFELAQLLIELISSPAENIREQALIGLTKLNVYFATTDYVIGLNITGSILTLVKAESSVEILRKVAHFLERFCTDGSEKFSIANIGEIISTLCILIKKSDKYILYDTFSTIRMLIKNYTDCNEKMRFFIDSGILVDLIPQISHSEVKIKQLAFESIFNIIDISDENIRVATNQNLLSYFPVLLTHHNVRLQVHVLKCLSFIIARSPSQVQVAIDLNLVPIVVANLRHEGSQVQEYSALTIANTARKGTEDQIKELFCSDVMIEHLFGELQHCYWLAKEYLLEGLIDILKIYCANMPSLKIFKQIMPIILELINDDFFEINTSAVLVMTIFTDYNEEQIQLLIDGDIVPKLISFLSDPDTDPDLLKASLCLIGNIVLGSDNQIDFVFNNKLLSIFPKLLSHKYADIVDKSLFILNKINESGNRTDSIIYAGLLELIIENFKHAEFRIKKKSTFVISNMTLNANKDQITVLLNVGAIHPFLNMAKCHDAETIHIVLNGMMNIMTTYHNEPPMPNEINEQIDLTLQHLIHHADDNILERTAWALSYFLDGGDENIQLVIDSDIVKRLIELLENLEESIKIATLHILCKIVSYATEHQLDLDFNVSSNLSPLLIHPLDEIREVSLTILSHLSYGKQAQADLLFDEVLLSNIIENLSTGKIEIKKLALIIVSNLTMHITKKDQMIQLLPPDVLSKFIEMIICNDLETLEVK